MNGCGNDFAIFDARQSAINLSPEQIAFLADRHHSIGFDQLIMLLPATESNSLATMHIYNADGSSANTCGNATRCVGRLLLTETNNHACLVETKAGILRIEKIGDQHLYQVDMGIPRLKWQEIPLAKEQDTLEIAIDSPLNSKAVAVNMGNPHIVFFVEDLEAVDIDTIGALLETHPLFPEAANINFAQIVNRNSLRLIVWERGVGRTLACGSGACATLVAASRRNLTDRKADIQLPGGTLAIEWLENQHVLMTGSADVNYHGTVTLDD